MTIESSSLAIRVAHPLRHYRKGWVIERKRDRLLSINPNYQPLKPQTPPPHSLPNP
jgi:hypothetical protein